MNENIRVFPEFCPRETRKFMQAMQWTIKYLPYQIAIKVDIKNIVYACVGCVEGKCKFRKCEYKL